MRRGGIARVCVLGSVLFGAVLPRRLTFLFYFMDQLIPWGQFLGSQHQKLQKDQLKRETAEIAQPPGVSGAPLEWIFRGYIKRKRQKDRTIGLQLGAIKMGAAPEISSY